MSNILYSDSFAYDASNKILSKGEVFDYDAINQSIENILSTGYGERLFNPYFGSILGNILFEGMNKGRLNGTIGSLIKEIYIWENRVVFIEEGCRFDLDEDNNTAILNLVYIIKRSGIKSTFKRKIRF